MTRPLLAVSAVLLASAALGQEPTSVQPPTDSTPAVGAPTALALTLPWTEPSGRGVAFSYENGAFGQAWEQGLKIQFPVVEHLAINLRPMVLMSLETDANPTSQIAVGGRLELIGRTAVLLNLIRIYGGGGGGPFVEVTGPNKGKVTGAGGGQFGVEFFLVSHASFYLEIGGNGCGALGSICSGATAVAGVSLYPF
jgi:hypothetical protein